MRLAALLLVFTLSGCAATGGPKSVVACQVADTVTTVVAINKGAIEMNPLLAGVLDVAGVPGLILVKAAFTYWIYTRLKQAERADQQGRYVVGTAINMFACGAAVSNYSVIKGMQ